jgi:hypothetical protein
VLGDYQQARTLDEDIPTAAASWRTTTYIPASSPSAMRALAEVGRGHAVGALWVSKILILQVCNSLAQIPDTHRYGTEILIRADFDGSQHPVPGPPPRPARPRADHPLRATLTRLTASDRPTEEPDLGAYRFGPVTSRPDTAVCPIVH